MAKTLDEKILESKARVAELERQQREKERKEREKKRKEMIRKQIIIGGYLIEKFPELLSYTLGKNNAETDTNFEEFILLISKLTDKHQSLLDRSLDEVRAEIRGRNNLAHLQVSKNVMTEEENNRGSVQ